MKKPFLSTRELTVLAMLCAIAYVLVAVIRIPVVLFLKYEPKDVVIAIGGFMLGPAAALIASCVVSLLEMVTVSGTGIWGLVMNILSTCCFACVAAAVYRKKHTQAGAAIGLLLGTVCMTAGMLLWNYLITPIYMGQSRQDVAALLLPAFLPFNLLKAGLNSAITLLLYKPVVTGLRRLGLLAPSAHPAKAGRSFLWIPAGVLLVTCVLLILVLRGIL